MTAHRHFFEQGSCDKVRMAKSERDIDHSLHLENKKCEFLNGLHNLMRRFQQYGRSTLLPADIHDIINYDKAQISELSQQIKQRCSPGPGASPKPARSVTQQLHDLCEQLTNTEIQQLIQHLEQLLRQRHQQHRQQSEWPDSSPRLEPSGLPQGAFCSPGPSHDGPFAAAASPGTSRGATPNCPGGQSRHLACQLIKDREAAHSVPPPSSSPLPQLSPEFVEQNLPRT